MTNFTIRIANKTVAVSAIFESTQDYCAGYLTDGAPDFSVSVTQADLEFERAKSIREDELEGIPYRQFSDPYLETIAVQRKITEQLFAFDTLLFHGSVIAVDGEAYLFTAKSGTGKSTHTRLWRELLGDRAVMVNDDKPFLEITPNSVIAHGSPWNGKHGLGSPIAVPLKAVCILERGEINRIAEVSPQEAVFMLLQQSNRPQNRALLPQYMDLLDRLSRTVWFYRLHCNMDPEAARLAYTEMSK